MQDSSSATTHFCGPAPNKMFGSISGLGPICAILVFLLLFALRRALHRPRDIAATSSLSTGEAVKVLRADRVSVAIRTLQLAWTSWRETQVGRDQLEGFSWTGTSYSHETGTRPTGFSYVYKYLLVPQVESIAISSASTTGICIPVCCAQQKGLT